MGRLGVEPRVLEAVGRAGPLFGDVLHHGQQEGTELRGLLQGPLVLLHEHLVQAPALEVVDVPQLPWAGRQASVRHHQQGLRLGGRAALETQGPCSSGLTSPVEELPGVAA